MSGAERRREGRARSWSRAKNKHTKKREPRTEKENETPQTRRTRSLASLVVPRAERRQLELILRNQQKSAAEADQGFDGV